MADVHTQDKVDSLVQTYENKLDTAHNSALSAILEDVKMLGETIVSLC